MSVVTGSSACADDDESWRFRLIGFIRTAVVVAGVVVAVRVVIVAVAVLVVAFIMGGVEQSRARALRTPAARRASDVVEPGPAREVARTRATAQGRSAAAAQVIEGAGEGARLRPTAA